MKATEFADYFDFSIYPIDKDYVDFDDNYFNYASSEDDKFYMVSDNQGVFYPRFISKIEDLADCFDSMLDDYINEDVEESGFEYFESNEGEEYEQMLDYMLHSDEYKNTWACDIVSCLVNPSLIEDDVERSA